MTKSVAPRLNAKQMEQIGRALAEPRRVQLLKQIGAQAEACPCANLLEAHDITPATLSHHLKELETAGLILSTRHGKNVHLTVERDVLHAYLEQLAKI
jgi:ArsR family transcriptional regulator